MKPTPTSSIASPSTLRASMALLLPPLLQYRLWPPSGEPRHWEESKGRHCLCHCLQIRRRR
ncbi:hypothetical protein K443DRAFT_635531, partial [Laccaria amethystina LaAM-08-1]